MSRRSALLSLGACIVFSLATLAHAGEVKSLRLLYVGDKGYSRAEAYEEFLRRHAAAVEVADRHGFNPATADGFDVVLLDQPRDQERDLKNLASPLGPREKWSKPTVLIGRAGVHLAITWKLKGGVGCTCLEPYAYGLRDHEIFDSPFKIDRSGMKSITTPEDFKQEITDPTIRVLPLGDEGMNHSPGWCTYTPDFARYPDVELFCGGVNHKTPTAAALWRQGNLLHFGFDMGPREMTDVGRQMLLDSVAYISRFTQDRPIAVTPSVFAGRVAPAKEWTLRHLRQTQYTTELFTTALAPELAQKFEGKSRAQMLAWAQENLAYLRPDAEQLLELDPDLLAIKLAFDDPAFLDRMRTLATSSPEDRSHAARLISRYLPECPNPTSAESVSRWLDQNRAYLFASDSGDYRWYIDPLARQRQVPTSEFRGPRRADPARPAASE